jgi:uncharacterized membrane protein YjjP (DUF1212 family)
MSADSNNKSEQFAEANRFLIKLAEAAHAYGSTAARLEAFLSRLTRADQGPRVPRRLPVHTDGHRLRLPRG